MKQVTRNINPDSAHDLLEQVPRACLTFAQDGAPQAQPITLLWQDQRYLVGIPQTADHQPESDQEAVLLVDEGVYFFDLRAIYIRGHVTPIEVPDNAPDGFTWFELIPAKTIAWDYGSMREVSDEH